MTLDKQFNTLYDLLLEYPLLSVVTILRFNNDIIFVKVQYVLKAPSKVMIFLTLYSYFVFLVLIGV